MSINLSTGRVCRGILVMLIIMRWHAQLDIWWEWLSTDWHPPPLPPPRTSHWRVKTPLTLSERLHFPSLCHRQHRLCFRCLFTPLTTACIRLCLAIQKPGEVMLLLLHLVVLNFTLRRTFFTSIIRSNFAIRALGNRRHSIAIRTSATLAQLLQEFLRFCIIDCELTRWKYSNHCRIYGNCS